MIDTNRELIAGATGGVAVVQGTERAVPTDVPKRRLLRRCLEVVGLLETPISAEKRRLLRARWEELPEDLRTPWQVVGRQLTHCGYTMGPAYCSFGCTHCYLPSNANRTPMPTLLDMKRQIDANRRLLGPDGALQITGGDVVDAYWKADRADELVEILRYANGVKTVPMLMTHGQVLLENPDYLDRLVVEGGLRKLAVHIDLTQAGRPGYPIRELRSEADLHPLRQAFVELILGCRRRTKLPLQAALTVTVTQRNLDSIADILRWLAAQPERLRAFRMVSFQTEADVGRTRMGSAAPVTPEAVWARIGEAFGKVMTRDAWWFGHPDCSSMTTMLIDTERGRSVDFGSSDPAGRRFWTGLLQVFGGVGSRGLDGIAANAQRAGLLVRHPGFVWVAARFVAGRIREQGSLTSWLRSALRGRVGVLNVVMHNFMDGEQVAKRGDDVDRRLRACAFRGAIEQAGVWRAVPMCELNALERERLYARQIASRAPASSGNAFRPDDHVGAEVAPSMLGGG